MTCIRRGGFAAMTVLVLLAACNPAPPPTAVIVTMPPQVVTIQPTEDPSLQSPSLIAADLGPVAPNARPRVRVSGAGTAHVAWLERQTGNVSLHHRWWTPADRWSGDEVWQTWQGTSPIQWDMTLDGSGLPHAIWSEPGRLTLLRWTGPGAWLTEGVKLAVGGDLNSREYATNFGFAMLGSAVYLVYRDPTPQVPNFRLGFSPDNGKTWEAGPVILTDPYTPTQVHRIALAVSSAGVLHLTMNAGDQLYLHANPDALGRWRGLKTGRDLFEEGRLGDDLALDTQGFPHVILSDREQLYYRHWDGRSWVGPQSPLLGASRGVMAFDLGIDDLAWVIGTAPPDQPRGLWLRMFKGEEASAPVLLKAGEVTECDIDVEAQQVHILAVIDGRLWHFYDQVWPGVNLTRQQIQ